MNELELTAYLRAKRLDVTFRELYTAAFMSVMAALFFCFLLKEDVEHFKILIWIILIFKAAIIESIVTHLYRKQKLKASLKQWEVIHSLSSLFTALSWAILSFVMIGVDVAILNYVYITLVLAVALAGAFANIAFEKTAILYIVIVVASIMIRTLIEQQDYYIWYIALQTLFVFYCARMLTIFSRTYYKAELSSVRLEKQLALEKQLQEEKLKSIQSAKLASLGEMAAGISHEINNPLSLLRGRIDMLKDMSEQMDLENNQIDEFLKSAIKSTDRINKIIQSMKNLSRMKDEVEYSEFQLIDVVEDVKTLVIHRLKQYQIELKIEMSAFNVVADKSEISQVFLNLINNAIDAIESLDHPLWIKVKSEEKDNEYLVHVIDSGSGIPQDIADKLFLPFFTSKDVGKGTGLGLSLSKNLMNRNQGELYYNDQAQNTCFTVVFPKKMKV
ncbi:MAG: hypothetical protein CME62_03610 [Halobacteriovoraceae bacterium]|nr:hypothetical protein [Halobacteriovoraceae bacterium]|tara:strand:- start:10471 stop:11805 length:1335 start_codon:yes stop_codon:yes gene_type:complete